MPKDLFESSSSSQAPQAPAGRDLLAQAPAHPVAQSAPTVAENATPDESSSPSMTIPAVGSLIGLPGGKPWSYFRDQVYAGALGTEMAAKQVAAFGAKAVAHLMNPELKKEIQSSFESDYQDYAGKKAVQEHPYAALAGNLLGGSAVTAGLPVGVAGSVFKTVAPVAGKALGYAAGTAAGATEGAAIGGVFTQPGQGEDVLNKQGMAVGGITGGLLAPVGIRAGNYAQTTQKFNEGLKQTDLSYKGQVVPGADYKGPVFARDFLENYNAKLGNEIFDNLGDLGTGGARQEQVDALKQSFSTLNQYLIKRAGSTPLQTISNQLKKVSIDFKDQRNQIFNDVYNKLDSELGKITIPDTYKASTSEILNDFGSFLTKQEKNNFNQLTQIKQATPSAIKTIKNTIWDVIDRIDRKANSTTQEDDLLMSLKGLYGQSKDMVENVLSSSNKLGLLTEYKAANQFERIRQEVFNPKLHPEFARAIEDKGQELVDVQKFVDFLTNPKQSEKAVRKYMGLIGNEGQDALEAQTFNKILEKNIDRSTSQGIFNLKGFTDDIETMGQSAQKFVIQDAKNSIQGLLNVIAKPNVQAKLDASRSQEIVKNAKYIGGTALLTGSYISGGPAAAGATLAATLATIKTMAMISANSPLKRTLNYINQAADSPGMAEYLIEKASTLLQRAGIVLTTTPEGSLKLQHKDELKKNPSDPNVISGYTTGVRN